MKLALNRLALATVLSLAFTPLAAQDYDKGNAAYDAGDYATAIQEFTFLAEQGDTWSQVMVGAMHDTGQGVLQDYNEAAKWYRLGAENGEAVAQGNLGILYRNGNGVPKDHAEAVKLFRLAAEQGLHNAQYNLGVMYIYGSGVLQDNVMAHMWLNIATVNGDKYSREYRNEAAAIMTPADISKAQAMARECMSSNYTKCRY